MTKAALLYLGLPLMIFWGSYVGGFWTLVAIAWGGIMFCFVLERRRVHASTPFLFQPWIWFAYVALAVLVLILVGFPYGPYPWDWIKHWALINLLIDSEWPVRVTLQGESLGLRFYTAAYMVPAAIGKVFAELPRWMPVAAWFLTGMVILFALLAGSGLGPSSRGGGVTVPLFIVMMAGADLVAERGVRWLSGKDWTPFLGFHQEWWAADVLGFQVQYTSMLSSLVWVPHQSLATGLATILLVRTTGSMPWAGVAAFGTLSLWSPFGMIGLLPFVVWRLVQFKADWAFSLEGWSRLGVIGLASLFGAIHLFDGAGSFSLIPSTGIELVRRLILAPPFLIVELLPVILILRRRMLTAGALAIATISLLVLPLFAGQPLDFVMRGSFAPLFVLFWHASDSLARWGFESRLFSRVVVTLGLFLSSLTMVGEAIFLSQNGAAHLELAEGDPLNTKVYTTFSENHVVNMETFFDTCGWVYLPQYFSPFPRLVERPKDAGRQIPQAHGSPD